MENDPLAQHLAELDSQDASDPLAQHLIELDAQDNSQAPMLPEDADPTKMTGGIGYNVPPKEAAKIARQRVYQRAIDSGQKDMSYFNMPEDYQLQGWHQINPVKNAISKVARPVLEFGGMTVGGILGTPADAVSGPTGTVVGAGLGLGIGKGAADTLDVGLGSPLGKQLANRSTAQGIADTANNVMEGSMMEMGGKIVPIAAGKIGDGVRSTVRKWLPEDATANELSKLNNELKNAYISKSKLDRSIATNADADQAKAFQSIVEQDAHKQNVVSTNQAYRDNVQKALDLQSQYPDVMGKTALGKRVSSQIDSIKSASKEDYDKAYKAVTGSLEKNQPEIQITNIPQTAKLLEDQQGLGAIEGIQDFKLKSISSNISKDGPIKATWNDLQADFRNINGKLDQADKMGDGNAYQFFSTLKVAVQKDMEDYVSKVGGDTKGLFDVANKKFQEHQELFGTHNINNLTSKVSRESDLITGKLTSDNNTSLIENLKKIMPEDEFKHVQAKHLESMMSPVEKGPFDKVAPFDLHHFVKKFEGIGPENLEAVYGKDGYEALKTVYGDSKVLSGIKDLRSLLDEATQAPDKAGVNSILDRARKMAEDSAKEAYDAGKAEDYDKINRKIESIQKEIERTKSNPVTNKEILSAIGHVSTGLGALETGFQTSHPFIGALAAGGVGLNMAIRSRKGIEILRKLSNPKLAYGPRKSLSLELIKLSAIGTQDTISENDAENPIK